MQLKRTLSKNRQNLFLWWDENYLGCSQEGIISHYMATRLAKLPNAFKRSTIAKFLKIKEIIYRNV